MKPLRQQIADGDIPSLTLLALGQTMPLGMCWKCSREQNYYASPCEHCGAINPNFDLDGAIAQQQRESR